MALNTGWVKKTTFILLGVKKNKKLRFTIIVVSENVVHKVNLISVSLVSFDSDRYFISRSTILPSY
ncbi:hypothetical protein GCM10011413_14450 [Pedobacter psychrotolerans]|uniref:Uncharacterized protein n=1 Tax=Pedobacter psychrotolerans TaxID=1843235 RepID=A0ABQ1SMN9_9SPHI|nr:hypothetical protein GCM10011413_14450 [Pedobacter psychrotolerans]